MTFLDDLREEAEAVKRHATLDIGVPGSRYVVRFRPPSNRDSLDVVVAAYRRGAALTGDQERQLIVDCCDRILRGNTETGDLEDPDDDGPLTFDASDERWGDVKTARECVAKLYKLKDRPLAASGTCDALVDWLQGITDEAMRRVEGESDGGADSSATPPASTSTD